MGVYSVIALCNFWGTKNFRCLVSISQTKVNYVIYISITELRNSEKKNGGILRLLNTVIHFRFIWMQKAKSVQHQTW